MTSVLLKAITNGSRVLYMMEHAYIMLDINVVGFVVRGVSTTYTTTVGKDDANESVMMEPDADHVNTSIWPGVSMNTWLQARKTTGEAAAPALGWGPTRKHLTAKKRPGVPQLRGAFFKQTQHLVKLGGKQVQGRNDAAVGAKLELLHDFFVVHGVTDVHVGFIGRFSHSGVQVNEVRRQFAHVCLGVDALQKRCFAAASHANNQAHDGRRCYCSGWSDGR